MATIDSELGLIYPLHPPPGIALGLVEKHNTHELPYVNYLYCINPFIRKVICNKSSRIYNPISNRLKLGSI